MIIIITNLYIYYNKKIYQNKEPIYKIRKQKQEN